MKTHTTSTFLWTFKHSGVASYVALGHVPPPSTSNSFILVHFEVNLTVLSQLCK